MKTLKEVAHLYLGNDIRMFNAVTKEWSKWRKMSCTDLNLILNHDAKVELILDSEIKNFYGSAEAMLNLTKNRCDLFGLLQSGQAVPF